jgi:hypothetical protein
MQCRLIYVKTTARPESQGDTMAVRASPGVGTRKALPQTAASMDFRYRTLRDF